MTVRYRCNNQQSPHSFNGYEEGLIRQLPKHIQNEFPAILTKSSGISTKLMKLMRPLFQSGVGPHRMHKILRVMHHEHFDELQLQYYDKIMERKRNPTLFDSAGTTFAEFSTFNDKKKYAGLVPCANFLSYVYSSYIQQFVPYMDQLNSMLDGVVLKGDHSFKIIKHMGKTNGTSVFSSLYTVNE